MLAGAGSVGKTSLMDACSEMASSRGLTTVQHYSSTRKSYADAGLTSESDALKDPEFNRQFQHRVMADNISHLYATVKSDATAKFQPELFITDRSPYDYSSYYFTVFNNTLTLKTIRDKREEADESLVNLLSVVRKINIVLLPYPTSWARDTESSDGWRADKTGKNFAWSAMVEAELADARRRFAHMGIYRDRLEIGRLPSFVERGSPEVRAVGILTQVFPHLR